MHGLITGSNEVRVSDCWDPTCPAHRPDSEPAVPKLMRRVQLSDFLNAKLSASNDKGGSQSKDAVSDGNSEVR